VNDWVIRLIDQSGYLGVGFLMFLETVFPPIPSEVIMTVAGIAAARGKLDYGLIVASGTAGAMLGNIFWYLAARALGILRLEPLIRRHGRWLTLDWNEVLRAESWFRRNGVFFVFLGRMVPTIRSLVSIPAGLLRMRFRTFLIASTLGTAGWTALIAGAGYRLGANVAEVEQFIGPAANAVLVVLAGGYLWRLWSYRPDARGKDDAS
jgi:membrane protein DedA with SNARE-associated domain